ncbi:MAG: CoA-binding protein [Patescibacteria group bacterium]
MLNLKNIKSIAVIGASNNQAKFGYKIVKNLLSRNFVVVPINQGEKEILEQKVYSGLAELNTKVDLLVFVVPPESGLLILQKAYQLGYRKFWFQPGAESQEIKEFLQTKKDLDFVLNSCIMF